MIVSNMHAINGFLSDFHINDYSLDKEKPFDFIETFRVCQANTIYMVSHVVLSTGYPGSGKTVMKNIFSELGVATVSLGDIVRDKYTGETKTSPDIGNWATKQRKEHGQNIIARWSLEPIRQCETSTVFVDGVRSPTSIDLFKSEFETVTVIYIRTKREKRLQYIKTRGREDEQSFTLDDLQERDLQEEKWGLDQIIVDYADVTITNNRSLPAYREKVRKIAEKLT